MPRRIWCSDFTRAARVPLCQIRSAKFSETHPLFEIPALKTSKSGLTSCKFHRCPFLMMHRLGCYNGAFHTTFYRIKQSHDIVCYSRHWRCFEIIYLWLVSALDNGKKEAALFTGNSRLRTFQAFGSFETKQYHPNCHSSKKHNHEDICLVLRSYVVLLSKADSLPGTDQNDQFVALESRILNLGLTGSKSQHPLVIPESLSSLTNKTHEEGLHLSTKHTSGNYD